MPRSTAPKRPRAPRGARAAEPVAKGSNLQTLKRQLVREEILRSAAKLFADHGVHGVSIDEVASGLGYTKSSVYYYFKSKDELLWAVFGYISEHFVGEAERIAQSAPDPVARLTDLVRMHVRFLAEHKEWATVFYRDVSALPQERQAQVRAIIVRYDAFFRQAVQEGGECGRMRPLRPDIVVNAVLGACNWMVTWISQKHRDSIDEIAETYVKLFTGGLVLGQPSNAEGGEAHR
ncbi:TetR/AcrR family transcriptional regulator [Bradyrhizobium sp. Pear77]|uniref:TetR/AcrR family transcriptional regulator n=1 Tax=Bradyrhizobium TaxID=374 RepID=UPI001E56F42A|nr:MULTISPECIES: TetR/AcrR family transcriptional regulator [Bradyrhizobium]MCC8954351.1 TetR/AcrR family transcriptional regulator [Bradyrhizobium altum]MCC8964389.1 TetR/AcrR family transcriptional regulator [Bradyrhizobium oropedii]